MVDKVSFPQTNLLYNVNSTTTQPTLKAHQQLQEPTPVAGEILDKKLADATKAYAIIDYKQTPSKGKSLEELKADLIAKGKIEGKDFLIEASDSVSVLTILENQKTKEEFMYGKDNSGKEVLDSITDFSYPLDSQKGLKEVRTVHDADGKFMFRTFEYEKDKFPYKDDVVNIETTPAQLVEHFKANGIKFVSNSNIKKDWSIQKYSAFNPKDNGVTEYEFTYDKSGKIWSVIKSLIDNDGSTNGIITYYKDTTSYTEYKDSFIA